MLSLSFAVALVVGVVVALVVLIMGMPVVSLDRWNEGLHDFGGDTDGSSLFDFSSSDSSDSSSDSNGSD